jgi:hypothetical protein
MSHTSPGGQHPGSQQRIIPIYASNGEAEAFLAFPFLFNRSGDWIGWVTPQRDVYSVMGYYVGYLTNDPRIVRKRATNTLDIASSHPRLRAVSPLQPQSRWPV